jgi:uncharacterized protein YaiE (UPF0345 family)
MGIRAGAWIAVMAVAMAAVPANADSVRVLTFLNRTCGALNLAIQSEDPCAGFSPGCEFKVPADSSVDLSLTSSDFTPFFNTVIKGGCDETPPAVIEGSCAFDAARLFPQSSVTVTEGPPPELGLDLYDTLDMYDPYESLFGSSTAEPRDYPPVMITLELGDCELSPDGAFRRCGVNCRRLTY